MFGRNLHLLGPRIEVERTESSAAFLSEVSGLGTGHERVVERRTVPHLSRLTGKRITPGDVVHVEHGDGRIEAHTAARTVEVRIEELGIHPNDFRRLIYMDARRTGLSHDEAVARLFPEGKVEV